MKLSSSIKFLANSSPKYLLVLLSLLYISTSQAKYEKYIDSLKNQLEIGSEEQLPTVYALLCEVTVHLDAHTAIEYATAGLTIARKNNNKAQEAACLVNLASAMQQSGDNESAMEILLEALSLSEESNLPYYVGKCYHGIGVLLSRSGEEIKAQKYLRQSLELFVELADTGMMAQSCGSIGYSQYRQGKYTESMINSYRAISLAVSIGDPNDMRLNYFDDLGSAYMKLNQLDSALHYFEKCLYLSKINDYNFSISVQKVRIGEVYYRQGKYEESEISILEGLKLNENGRFLDEINWGYFLLHEMRKKQGRFEEALTFHEKYFANNERALFKKVKNMQFDYLIEKKSEELAMEKELADLKTRQRANEVKQESFVRLILGLAIFFAILVVLFIYKRFKTGQKQNKIIALQKTIVEYKNKEITDSIQYAKRIQSAILPPMSLMNEKLKNGFVLYKPKDIVAGDFYWLETVEDDIYFSAADCTGHGVPGAMMSVMCSNALTKSVKELGLTKPGEILDATTKIIEGRFERSEQMVLDGMDLALCKLNLKTMKLEYAGANNPLWIIRAAYTIPPHQGGGAEDGGGETSHKQTMLEETKADDSCRNLIEVKADKQPIGMYNDRKPYTNHKIHLQKGDSIYIFSDGYVDQFGGPKGKKFKSKPFKQLLLSIQKESMDKQKELIEQAFEDWRGSNEQVDDVCVIGVKI